MNKREAECWGKLGEKRATIKIKHLRKHSNRIINFRAERNCDSLEGKIDLHKFDVHATLPGSQ